MKYFSPPRNTIINHILTIMRILTLFDLSITEITCWKMTCEHNQEAGS
jgi:DNA-binding CsgD family transcriptional regulator